MSFRTLRRLCLATVLLASNSITQSPASLNATNAPPISVTSPAPAPSSVDELKRQVETGNADAEQKLGMAYYNGQIVAKDNQLAFAWCLKAANQGNLKAEFNVAYFYAHGEGVAKDEAHAFQWYLKTANSEVPAAELVVGNDYFYGIGVTKDLSQAIAWYRKASIQGNTDAQIRFGFLCLQNKKNPEAMKTGFAYLLRNARGNAYAASWIACCYRDGIVVSKDPVQSYTWFLHASSLPSTNETKDLPTAAALVKASLTTDQIAQAEKALSHLSDFLVGRIQPPDLAVTFDAGSSAVVPFEFVNNAILLPVRTWDGKTAYLLFDTGCGMSCLSDRFAARMGLKSSICIPMDGIGENISLSNISDETAFALPGLTFTKTRWAILPDFNDDAEFGQPIVGVLGLDLTKKFVIHLDFIKHTMEFLKPGDFQPPVGSVCLPLTVINQRPLIETIVAGEQGEVKGSLLIDTGDTGSLNLTKIFLDRNPSLKFKILSSSASSGLGGIIDTDSVICPTLRLGGITLPNIPTDLDRTVQGVEVTINGNIGTELWRRFDVVFDFPNQKLYLQKNARFSDPHSYTSAGMHIMASGDNYQTLSVHEVLPNSAAARAGFQTGDILVKIDELGNASLAMSNVYPLLHQAGSYHFRIKRGDQTLFLTLELKNPPPSDIASPPQVATPLK